MRKELVFTFRLSDADRDALFATATAYKLNPSEFLRDVLRREARKLNLWPPQSYQDHGGEV